LPPIAFAVGGLFVSFVRFGFFLSRRLAIGRCLFTRLKQAREAFAVFKSGAFGYFFGGIVRLISRDLAYVSLKSVR
jgi:hypothetical protein